MRLVALSDQHGFLPEIQPCDLLIVAGDVCPDRVGPSLAERDPARQKVWFDQQVRPWLARSSGSTQGPHMGEPRLVRPGVQLRERFAGGGNHDRAADPCGRRDQRARGWSDRSLDLDLGFALVNKFQNWAFMKSRAELAAVYAKIPDRIDILISAPATVRIRRSVRTSRRRGRTLGQSRTPGGNRAHQTAAGHLRAHARWPRLLPARGHPDLQRQRRQRSVTS